VTGVLLHEAIGHGMEADFNWKKTSTYCTMIGKKVAEPFITIVDDGTVPNLLGFINFDDEGTPGQRTVLVDKGILTSYMHDKISAKFYGVKPTGNGPKMLANITLLANDFELCQGGSGSCGKAGQAVPCGFGQPSCLVKSLTVGGTKG
jgi:predicted Zn-dependent protease